MVALVVESWIWYGVVLVVAVSRFISRHMTLRTWKRFGIDDYLMVAVLCFYTALIATINIVRSANTNLIPPGVDYHKFTKDQIDDRQMGSKLVLVVEQCQCVTIWGAKATLLIMYLHLTTMRREHIFVWALIGYVAFSFVFMEIFYFAVWCRPFSEYWAIPTSSHQCNAATNHLITNAVFNISSDCLMLAIGLPMFLRLRLPLKKKIPTVGIFSLGIFVILAAVLNKVYSFNQPFGSAWTYWYVRESSTALLVANLPFVWAFWRRITGQKTTEGISRQTSHPLESKDRNARATVRRKEESRPWNTEHFADSEDLEMGDRQPSMSLGDILSESNPNIGESEQVSPITHPSLFFGTPRTATPANAPKAVVGDKTHSQVVRRDIDSEGVTSTTPASSTFPSLNSKKSAGSFL
ncbi:hypothetical protein KC338_g7913 [Hortaea werneckii]|uniref:Rhodopsin domain-containing protein n=1 Tax=Hortaea werneckii TaxID=91943 RepID=A0A3M7ENQ0_HORWE|nr:hypothetical protein KC323_g8103 [Hortaea werneckii]KAI6857939.1 hypothetical protein KC338_g7913 [Hortaea werneckii]KAI7351622.1 hypothetical protein KC320_g4872 [Hortaea werneckii]RMY78037.1 hypothetical protein D0863_00937 [Hortaea werneckii]